MKRVIKFRAWATDTKEMIPFDQMMIPEWFDDETIIIQQFTGLLDKNGKDIYEGDIIRKMYGASIPMFSVAWDDKRAMFIQNDGYNEPLHQLAPNSIEVAGDIYKNPDLIITK